MLVTIDLPSYAMTSRKQMERFVKIDDGKYCRVLTWMQSDLDGTHLIFKSPVLEHFLCEAEEVTMDALVRIIERGLQNDSD